MKVLYLILRQVLLSEGLDPAEEIVVDVMPVNQVVAVADNTDFFRVRCQDDI